MTTTESLAQVVQAIEDAKGGLADSEQLLDGDELF